MHDAARLHPKHCDEPPVQIDDRRRSVALVVLCLCALTTAVDITITNVALPFIGSELDASTSELQWVVDAYNILLAGLLVLGGGLADRYGRKRVFLGGYALFGTACLIAAFSPTSEVLIGARALMGMGAAGVIAPALAIVAGMFPPEARGRAIALWAVFGAMGLAIGPVLGGLLLDSFWWGSVFLVNVPIVAAGVIVGLAVIPESCKPDPGALDVPGAVLSVVGLSALLFGLIEGPDLGWGDPAVLGAIGAGLVVLVLFVRHELRTPSPMLDVRILLRPIVAAASANLFVTYLVFTGMLFVLPQYLGGVRGESIISIGLLLAPFAIVFGAASMRASSVLARLGGRPTLALGLVLNAVGVGLLAVVIEDELWMTIAATMVVGVGMSLLIAPASTVLMNDLSEDKAGDGSSLSMVSRFVGATFGVAVTGSVLASVYSARVDDVRGLPPQAAATAEGSLEGALDVAKTLPSDLATTLTSTARDAFVSGARAGYVVAAVLAVVGACVTWRVLRPRRPKSEPVELDRVAAEDLGAHLGA